MMLKPLYTGYIYITYRVKPSDLHKLDKIVKN